MHVARLQLHDFRSYADVDLVLSPGATVFVGSNGQGKTNLLEALRYLATLGSHRVALDAPLVRSGCASAVIRAELVRDHRQLLAELEIHVGRANRARLNRGSLPRVRDVLGALRAVLFAPEDLAVVKGDPAERRAFLDELLTMRAPRYAGVRADYERVVRQRNALLRAHAGRRQSPPALEVWDEQLAAVGAELLAGRLALVDELSPLVAKAYDAVAPAGGEVAVHYASRLFDPAVTSDATGAGSVAASSAVPLLPARADLAELLLAALAARRPAELERGVTLVGPHRDDLQLLLGGFPAKGYASHGESWSLALALRLAAFDLLRSDGDDPVLLLDDVFAELDEERRRRLGRLASDAEQVLVTAAVDDDVPDSLRGARFAVSRGQVLPEGAER